jgi:hypothetical protein
MADEPKPGWKCDRCGRLFLTIPRSGRDPYWPLNKYMPPRSEWPTNETCGGRVVSFKAEKVA